MRARAQTLLSAPSQSDTRRIATLVGCQPLKGGNREAQCGALLPRPTRRRLSPHGGLVPAVPSLVQWAFRSTYRPTKREGYLCCCRGAAVPLCARGRGILAAERGRSMNLALVVMPPGKLEGKAIPITLPRFIIGRDPQCQLRPASPVVSKRHCALLCRGERARAPWWQSPCPRILFRSSR